MTIAHPLRIAALVAVLTSPVFTQTPKPTAPGTKPSNEPGAPSTVPTDYVIGAQDVLSIVFWRDKEMSGDVVVRPDGKISLPMLNDVPAAGLTPEALATAIATAATKFVKDPGATVIVREIHSRKIYIIGDVARQGSLLLGGNMNVLQALGEAGGFIEGANKSDVVIVRNEGGKERRFRFNYDEVLKGKNLEQNIQLAPGDTIIVR